MSVIAQEVKPIKIAKVECNEVLGSCVKTVKVQKKAIDDQKKVIGEQDKLLDENKKEIKRLHVKEDISFWTAIGSNAIWLLILLL